MENVADIQERVYRGRLDTPKTQKSIRFVALSTSIRQDLNDWLVRVSCISKTGVEAFKHSVTERTSGRGVQKPSRLSWELALVQKSIAKTKTHRWVTKAMTSKEISDHLLDVPGESPALTEAHSVACLLRRTHFSISTARKMIEPDTTVHASSPARSGCVLNSLFNIGA